MSPAPRPARAGSGFVLVTVLGGLLLVGAVAFALLFTASLDAMAASAKAGAVVAREELEGALALAVAALRAAPPSGPEAPVPTGLGPWPELGIGAVVNVESLPADGSGLVLRLSASLPSDPARRPEALVVQLEPELRVLRR